MTVRNNKNTIPLTDGLDEPFVTRKLRNSRSLTTANFAQSDVELVLMHSSAPRTDTVSSKHKHITP